MSIISKTLSFLGYEQRSVDPSWQGAALMRGGNYAVGNAESLSTVYACVSAISETIASLPLILYRRTADDGREKASNHPLYKVLHDQPNDWQTSLEFREMLQAAVLLRGNAFAEIKRGYDGQVRSLIPLSNDRVSVIHLDNGRLGYDVTDHKGGVRRLLQEEVFHLRHRSTDGRVGISPITASRQTVELALAERQHGTSTFSNGAKLSGILTFPGRLQTQQRDNIKNSWKDEYAGSNNAGKTPVLEEGVEYKPISMTSDDAQYLESRQFSVEEIARLFRVPPTIIGQMDKANYSNSVELARQFVTLTLRRHLVMWEQAISRALLTEAGRRTYFAEFSVEGLLRGDSTNRAEFYSKGLTDKWLMIDEVRKLENLPKLAANANSHEKTPPEGSDDEAGQVKEPKADISP